MNVKKLLRESLNNRKHYVGNCVNGFDMDGYCNIKQLPYNDTTDFAQAEENATKISSDEFFANVSYPEKLISNIKSNEIIYLHDSKHDVYMLYDLDNDIHYFFS
jgi:hypothetical protein